MQLITSNVIGQLHLRVRVNLCFILLETVDRILIWIKWHNKFVIKIVI